MADTPTPEPLPVRRPYVAWTRELDEANRRGIRPATREEEEEAQPQRRRGR